jgi:AcrR family transcriptional regulator
MSTRVAAGDHTAAPDLRVQALDAARHLIAAHGHREMSMRDIAAEVGCSVSTLYFHFANRDALIHTLIDEGFQRWYEELLELQERCPEPYLLLEAIARTYIEFGLDNPELYEIMYLFHPRSMERLPKEVFRRIRRSLDFTAATVRACAGADGLTEEDSRPLAAAIWATLHGVVSTLLTQRLDTRIDRARYIECAVHSVLATARFAYPSSDENGFRAT